MGRWRSASIPTIPRSMRWSTRCCAAASRRWIRNSACSTGPAIGCGSGRAAELAAAPGEQAPHLVGIAIDITEQKLADRLNQEAEIRLKDAIEAISEAFVLWDADNRLVICNSKYQQFHSLPAQRLPAADTL